MTTSAISKLPAKAEAMLKNSSFLMGLVVMVVAIKIESNSPWDFLVAAALGAMTYFGLRFYAEGIIAAIRGES